MKIDIHAHTKKVKSGDAPQRNIDVERFYQIIRETDVQILAITNHNHFDLDQYSSFREKVEEYCQIWPGVELDVQIKDGRGHLLIIVNPTNSEQLSEEMEILLSHSSEENLSLSIQQVTKIFDKLDPVYISHYNVKKPAFSDDDIELLLSLVQNKNRVIKEAIDSISCGIFLSHGHRSIYGSDVTNWDDYISKSEDLPNLRLPVDSFEQFCFLLQKDDSTINSILEKKNYETIVLNPFGEDEPISLKIYNDINILFGSKGTGKTEILKSLKEYYNNRGMKTTVYESNNVNLYDHYDIKRNSFRFNFEQNGIDSCEEEITFLRDSTESGITSISQYKNYYTNEIRNKIAKKLKIDKLKLIDDSEYHRKFSKIDELSRTIDDFYKYYSDNKLFKEIIGEVILQKFDVLFNEIYDLIDNDLEEKYINYQSTKFFNTIVNVFNKQVSRKTGQPRKPTSCGFKSYASNRINVEKSINKITDTLEINIKPAKELVGNLGKKGNLYCQTNVKFQNGKISKSEYKPIIGRQKNPQKYFARKLYKVKSNVYESQLFEHISELISDEYEEITSLEDLILFYRHFSIEDELYNPSNGESSMLLLYNELKQEKDVYMIDEPEKSLGNDYISDVIVPLLNEHAKQDKRVIIATHDANIAVRTLPYNSIYREHDIKQYNTYEGNPFSNNLICSSDITKKIDWKEISMRTLEGGKNAFGERGKIYGNV
ncbi:ATP-binding protein [Spirochaeta cellobiosiphila]|uniref:ATP-binding protein n=1 Tax=Spirochaeta cellobiosiphila TaxID=504483 RepID=UPI0004065C4F|nr:ATP-binding protein [Spirochaeta cellobiosiphila]